MFDTLALWCKCQWNTRGFFNEANSWPNLFDYEVSNFWSGLTGLAHTARSDYAMKDAVYIWNTPPPAYIFIFLDDGNEGKFALNSILNHILGDGGGKVLWDYSTQRKIIDVRRMSMCHQYSWQCWCDSGSCPSLRCECFVKVVSWYWSDCCGVWVGRSHGESLKTRAGIRLGMLDSYGC